MFGRDADGEPIGAVSIYSDEGFVPTATEENLLRGVADIVGLVVTEAGIVADIERSREWYLRIMDRVEIGVWEWSPRTDGVALDAPGWRLLGFDEPPGPQPRTDFTARVHPEDLDRIRHLQEALVLGELALLEAEYRFQRPSGDWIYLMNRGVAVERDEQGRAQYVIGTFQEVTRRKQSDDEYRRVQRLESLGQLAGGLAHDFNNILVGVFGGIENARALLPDDHTAVEDLALSHESLERARQMTSQLLTFSKGGEPIVGSVNLVDVISKLIRFEGSSRGVQCSLESPEELWSAIADLGQVQQVFSNLLLNAYDAAGANGRVKVSLENVEMGDDADLPSGDYVKVVVDDDGDGIEPELLDRVFEAYFSTKSHGTGLGLATARSIVHRHGGAIEVSSTPGEGSCFVVLLPAQRGHDAGVAHPASVATVDAGQAHVLVVDDEPNVRRVCASMLRRLGHRVTTVTTAEEGLRTYFEALQADQPFDLVIMDLTIPGGLGGEEAARILRSKDPNALLVASSGYAENAVMSSPAEHGFARVLPKPYTFDELDSVVRQVFARGPQ